MGGSTLFNGSSSVVQITNRPIYNLVNYSVSFLIKATPTATDKYIIHQGKDDSGTPFWGIGYYDATATNYRLRMFIRDDANNVISGAGYLTNPLVHGRWYHVIITDHGGSMKCYVDGVSTGLTPSYTRATITLNQTAFGAAWRTAVSNYFLGKLAEVKIFNSALTASQAAELYYTGSVSGVSPVANYALDDQPTTYIDSIGGNNGTGTNAAYSSDTPIQRRIKIRDEDACLSFINNHYVQISNPGINITEFSASFNAKTIWSYQNSGYNDWFSILGSGGGVMAIETGGSSAKPAFYRITGFSGAGEISAASNGTETAGFGWKKFHLVASKTGNYVRLYLNSILIGSSTWNPSSEAITILRIGTRANLTSRGITAKMNRVRIYSQPLTATEIADEFYSDIVNTSKLVGQYLLNEGTGSVATDTSGNGNHGTITGATWVTGGPIKLRSAASNRIPIAVPRTSV